MARHTFVDSDFFSAALSLVAERGPAAVTVGAITQRLKAPTGSFYHRFASRDLLLAELWLRTVRAFQEGIETALAAGDGLQAALHTPAWVREHAEEGRLLLLYHRDDFVQGEWPEHLRRAVAEHRERAGSALQAFACRVFGAAGAEEMARVQFMIATVPVAAVRPYLQRHESPPPIVDRLIRTTYRAVLEEGFVTTGAG